MNLLITGANGYISSKLIEYLLNYDFNILAVCRENDDVISKLISHKLTVVKQDLTKEINITLPYPIDFCIHLAAASDVESISMEEALKRTTLTTVNILEFCKLNSINKFIYFSTFQVYGSVEGEFNESRKPKPANNYGITHYFSEQYIEMYSNKNGIEYAILRPTNIYGAPVKKEVDMWRLVPGHFCVSAINTGKITAVKQARDFLNLSDLVKFTKYIISNFKWFSGKAFPIYSGNKFSILEIANIVKEEIKTALNKDSVVEISSSSPSILNEFSISEALIENADFTFEPKEGIRKEIQKTIRILTS